LESVKQRAESDPSFRAAMLVEASECFLNGEIDTAKTMLRDYVNATIGFQALAEQVEKPPKSLMRMLSKTGNPRAENLAKLFASLRNHEGVTFHVQATR
jgi:DNA-binding phage protein